MSWSIVVLVLGVIWAFVAVIALAVWHVQIVKPRPRPLTTVKIFGGESSGQAQDD